VFVGERLRDEDVLLVGYNAEAWQGGFDLPFPRSRYAAQDVPWLFQAEAVDTATASSTLDQARETDSVPDSSHSLGCSTA
jgi:hypothetical protein